MSDVTKIQMKVGIVEFSGEGSEKWLAEQLDKILERVPELLKIELASPSANPNANGNNGAPTNKTLNTNNTTLPAFLKTVGDTSNQNKRFLATAGFIQRSGKSRITTLDVSSALKNSNQAKLTNPNESLNQNVGKGFCEKDGKSFYVTPDGFKDLGIAE